MLSVYMVIYCRNGNYVMKLNRIISMLEDFETERMNYEF